MLPESCGNIKVKKREETNASSAIAAPILKISSDTFPEDVWTLNV